MNIVIFLNQIRAITCFQVMWTTIHKVEEFLSKFNFACFHCDKNFGQNGEWGLYFLMYIAQHRLTLFPQMALIRAQLEAGNLTCWRWCNDFYNICNSCSHTLGYKSASGIFVVGKLALFWSIRILWSTFVQHDYFFLHQFSSLCDVHYLCVNWSMPIL